MIGKVETGEGSLVWKEEDSGELVVVEEDSEEEKMEVLICKVLKLVMISYIKILILLTYALPYRLEISINKMWKFNLRSACKFLI